MRGQQTDSTRTELLATMRAAHPPRETLMINVHVPAMATRQDVREVSAYVSDVPGVQTLRVDVVARTLQVTGPVASAAVTAAVAAAGYAVASATTGRPVRSYTPPLPRSNADPA